MYIRTKLYEFTLIESRWSAEPNIENNIKCCFSQSTYTHVIIKANGIFISIFIKKNEIFSVCCVQWKIKYIGKKLDRVTKNIFLFFFRKFCFLLQN